MSHFRQARQPQPQHQDPPGQSQNKRLEDFHPLRLRDSPHSKRENRSPSPAKRGCESDRAHMEMSRQEFSGHDHNCREKGPQEKSLEGDGNR